MRRKNKFFEKDCLFIPFVKNAHWTLFVLEGFKEFYEEVLEFYKNLDEQHDPNYQQIENANAQQEQENIQNQKNEISQKNASNGNQEKQGNFGQKQEVKSTHKSVQKDMLQGKSCSSNKTSVQIMNNPALLKKTKNSELSKSEMDKISESSLLHPSISNFEQEKSFKSQHDHDFRDTNSKMTDLQNKTNSMGFGKHSISVDCFVAKSDNSIEEFDFSAFQGATQNKKLNSKKMSISEVPQTKNKIGIFHFDSMSNEDSKREYLIICKVFKHIMNYLLVKQINQELEHCEIVFTAKHTFFKDKDERAPESMTEWLQHKMGCIKQEGNADIPEEKLIHKECKFLNIKRIYIFSNYK